MEFSNYKIRTYKVAERHWLKQRRAELRSSPHKIALILLELVTWIHTEHVIKAIYFISHVKPNYHKL